MNDKRDEVKEMAKKDFSPDELKQPQVSRAIGWMADFAIRYAESGETELRRQIADELEDIVGGVGSSTAADTFHELNDYIDKLRDNK